MPFDILIYKTEQNIFSYKNYLFNFSIKSCSYDIVDIFRGIKVWIFCVIWLKPYTLQEDLHGKRFCSVCAIYNARKRLKRLRSSNRYMSLCISFQRDCWFLSVIPVSDFAQGDRYESTGLGWSLERILIIIAAKYRLCWGDVKSEKHRFFKTVCLYCCSKKYLFYVGIVCSWA